MNEFIPDILLIAYNAGKAILDVYNKDFDITYKDDLSPLTIADKQSNKIIEMGLYSQHLGRLPILSEEGRAITYDERKGWEIFWLIDPLDGTKEFIKRNGEFTVNIALIQKNKPILGVVYIPAKDVSYFAADGLGAYKLEDSEIIEDAFSKGTWEDGELLRTVINRSTKLLVNKTTNEPAECIKIVGSSSHATKEQEEFLENIKKKFTKVEFKSAGSSLKFCFVAEGLADIYPRFGPTMEWDTAAGQIIVEQAGGMVLDMGTNEPLKYNKENLLNPFFFALNREDLLTSV
ncbi:MAG: hypothetical protein A2035_02305 [Nitrospirae bacterium GWA2_42_11]|nr:MAG: hypothetical protein A2035_02305 [Nitrospirae bacterium GWA2_42_11]